MFHVEYLLIYFIIITIYKFLSKGFTKRVQKVALEPVDKGIRTRAAGSEHSLNLVVAEHRPILTGVIGADHAVLALANPTLHVPLH